MTEAEFQGRVLIALETHADSLVAVLRQLVEHEYPPEVASVDFEVFPDGFTSGFPVRASFLDGTDTEFFLFADGEAQYPSPVDPGLLDIPRIYDPGLEESLNESDEEADCYRLAGQALIPWFARCWVAAGGLQFGRRSRINLHDDQSAYDLVEQRRLAR